MMMVLIGINCFLQRGTKKAKEKANNSSNNPEMSNAADDVSKEAADPIENYEESHTEFDTILVDELNPDGIEPQNECEFVTRESDVSKYIKTEEMPSYSHDSGTFHIRF